MKRKALLTSTALLLVALICLATASYAWFTSGSANTVAEFKVKVSDGDGSIELAAANIGSSYANTGWKSGLTIDDFTGGIGLLPGTSDGNYVLTPVSTDGVIAADMFNAAPYDDVAYWNSEAGTFASGNGYIVLSFYARTAEAGSAPLNITLTDNTAPFNNAVKIGYSVTGATTPANLTICNIDTAGDSYKPVINAGSKIMKDGTGAFVLKEGAALGSTLNNGTFSSPTVTFDGENAQLITVAIWLEGQDAQCSGTIDVSDINVNIEFGAFTAANS